MLTKPVEQATYNVLRDRVKARREQRGDLQAVRRRSLPPEYGKMIDLMHLLLAYNAPGLPGYMPEGDVPGTDIHSLPHRDVLMRKYFPFSEKRGLINRFLKRENPFFKLVALSGARSMPVFYFFMNRKETEKKLDVFREKISSIIDWFGILFRKKPAVAFVDVRDGTVFYATQEMAHPIFTRDIFEFHLLADFLTAGVHYFLFREEETLLTDVDQSWKGQLSRLTEEQTCIFTDILGYLPRGNTEMLFYTVIEWIAENGLNTLIESYLSTTLILRELGNPGMLRDALHAERDDTTLFRHPSLFLYYLFRTGEEKSDEAPDMDENDRLFYLALREKPVAVNEGMERLLENEKMADLRKYCEEPLFYGPDEFRRLDTVHRAFVQALDEKVIILEQRDIDDLQRIAAIVRARFDLSGDYMPNYDLMGGLSRLQYDDLKIIYRKGLEKEWELLLGRADDRASEIFYRGRGLEEVLLFMIINDIRWGRGLHIENVSTAIIAEAERLRKNMEQWLQSDERVFIAVNYSDVKQRRMFLYNSDLLENIRKRERAMDNDVISGRISVFFKGRDPGKITVHSHAGSNCVSYLLSLVAARDIGAGDFRVSLARNSEYRPIMMRLERIILDSPSPPLVLEENDTYNLVLDGAVHSFSSIVGVIERAGSMGIESLSFVENSGEMKYFSELFETLTGRGVEVFHMPVSGTVFVFIDGVFVGHETVKDRGRTRRVLSGLFSFTESLAVQRDLDIPVGIRRMSIDHDNRITMRNITSSVEFAAKENRTESNTLHVFHDGSFILVLHNGRKIPAATEEELAVAAVNDSAVQGNLIVDHCAGDSGDTFEITDLLRLKIRLENHMRKDET